MSLMSCIVEMRRIVPTKISPRWASSDLSNRVCQILRLPKYKYWVTHLKGLVRSRDVRRNHTTFIGELQLIAS